MEQKNNIVDQFRVSFTPNYIPQGDETNTFETSYRTNIPVILKGPTGCGKTRFVEYMAYHLDLPVLESVRNIVNLYFGELFEEKEETATSDAGTDGQAAGNNT